MNSLGYRAQSLEVSQVKKVSYFVYKTLFASIVKNYHSAKAGINTIYETEKKVETKMVYTQQYLEHTTVESMKLTLVHKKIVHVYNWRID